MSMNVKLQILSFIAILAIGFYGCTEKRSTVEVRTKPNILLIAIDDLRPELGCYGQEYKNPQILTSWPTKDFYSRSIM